MHSERHCGAMLLRHFVNFVIEFVILCKLTPNIKDSKILVILSPTKTIPIKSLKHRFTWLFCKNMTKNNSPNFYFLIQDSRHCCERTVCGDPSLHARHLHSIIHAIYPSAGHVTRLGSPCSTMTKLYNCTQSGGHVT